MIKAILATGENGELGLNNNLPFQCKEDMIWFRQQTEHSAALMGSNTYESLSLKDGLPNRTNYVWASDKGKYKHCGVVPIDTGIIDGALIPKFKNSWHSHLYIIGGKQVYERFFEMEVCDEIIHTTIAGIYEADTFMDLSFLKDWECVEINRLSEKAVVKVYRRR